MMDIRSSSRTRRSSKPRSAQVTVTWRMSSSKHCAYSSSRTGHIPVSRACRSFNNASSLSCSVMTSMRVAGADVTRCTHNAALSSNSRGGRMAFKMSSVCFAEAVALGFFPDAPSSDFCSKMERVEEAWMERK